LNPVPIGVTGELHIGGDGLARGYLNQPELTKEKFIPNPFDPEKSARLYKTGDLARYLPDGNIEFIGRIDDQVKIRGFRIELGEIETALSNHPQIQQAVVLVEKSSQDKRRLVAYIVGQYEDLSSSQLQKYLQQRLPAYMLPSAFIILESFPLTSNGKIDRKVLLSMESGKGNSQEYIAPHTATEKILTKIWQSLLIPEQIGIYDNFFEIGGDSILSIQVVSRARDAGIQITPKQIFQYQTIAELSQVASTTVSIIARQELIIGTAPLTPIQKWFWEQNFSEGYHFNQSVLLQIPANISSKLMCDACQKLVEHHDALRLRFHDTTVNQQQVNQGIETEIPFTVIDLSTTTPILSQTEEIENIANQFQASLDLSAGPLLQVIQFNLGEKQKGRLLVIIHHLVVDGVSWRILLTDLEKIYQQLLEQKPIQIPAKTTAFIDWADKLQQYAQSEKLQSEVKYWCHQPWKLVSSLPKSKEIIQNKLTDKKLTESISVTLNSQETQQLLGAVNEAYNTQINDLLLTALGLTFADWTKNTMITIDLEGHGREEIFEDVDLSCTVGWFTSMFPVLLQIPKSLEIEASIKAVKEQLRSIPNRGIGYGVLRYLCDDVKIKEQIQQIPHPEISFNYLGQFDQIQSESDWDFATESTGDDCSLTQDHSHSLNINCLVESDKLVISWTYDHHQYQKQIVENLAVNYVQNLISLITHCQSTDKCGYTPSDFPEAQLNQAELDELLRAL
jgi:non-ribosomal peptide synthase protein (TIGR01720 family)